MRKLVILESPYAGNLWQRWRNRCYARRCMRDSLMRGEAPIASHLLFTQKGILCDERPLERIIGIEAGLEWCRAAELMVIYTDRGLSGGVRAAIIEAAMHKLPVEYRALDTDLPQ